MSFKSLVAGAICLLPCLPAQAATYDWSYVFGGGVQTLTGVIDGTLTQPGSTQVFVDALYDVQLNGTDFGAPLIPVNNEQWWYGAVSTPTVSLDGTAMNLCASEVAPCTSNGFMFDVGSSNQNFAFFAGEDRTENYPGFSSFDTFVADDWSMTERAAVVPLPAAFGLLLAALGGLFALRRRG